MILDVLLNASGRFGILLAENNGASEFPMSIRHVVPGIRRSEHFLRRRGATTDLNLSAFFEDPIGKTRAWG